MNTISDYLTMLIYVTGLVVWVVWFFGFLAACWVLASEARAHANQGDRAVWRHLPRALAVASIWPILACYLLWQQER